MMVIMDLKQQRVFRRSTSALLDVRCSGVECHYVFLSVPDSLIVCYFTLMVATITFLLSIAIIHFDLQI